jgi:hypothetical protein
MCESDGLSFAPSECRISTHLPPIIGNCKVQRENNQRGRVQQRPTRPRATAAVQPATWRSCGRGTRRSPRSSSPNAVRCSAVPPNRISARVLRKDGSRRFRTRQRPHREALHGCGGRMRVAAWAAACDARDRRKAVGEVRIAVDAAKRRGCNGLRAEHWGYPIERVKC